MRSLILFPTAICDSACRHCFYHEQVDQPQRTRIMPADTRRLALALGRIRDLSLSGGEPVLRRDLDLLLAPLLRIGRPRTLTLPTGGLHPELVEKAARGILSHAPGTRLTIALSFDGPPRIHDHMRGVHGAYDSLRRTHDLMAPLSDAGILDLKLVTTLCNFNLPHLEEAMDFARRHFSAAVFHHLEIMRGEGRDQSLELPDPEKIAALRPLIAGHWKGYSRFYGGGFRGGLARAAKMRLLDLNVDYLRGKDRMPSCHVHNTHLVVLETGEVSFCELTEPIGNLCDEDVVDILRGAEAKTRREGIAGCSCTHSCFTPANLAKSPREIMRVAAMALASC